MRIAYVCADRGVPVFGRKGCSVHVQEVLRVLLRRGDGITLFARRYGGSASRDLESVEKVRLPKIETNEACDYERQTYDSNRTTAQLVRQRGNFDLLYERFSLWSHGALEQAADLGVASIVEVNAPLIDEQAKHRCLHDRELAEESARRAFAAASAIVAVSDEVADWVSSRAPASANIHVLANGVCPFRFSPAVISRHRDNRKFTVGFVGSLRPWHGLDHLIDAYIALYQARSNVRLLVVGDGPQHRRIEDRLWTLSVQLRDTIEMIGSVSPDDIPGWLTSMDVAVAPYDAAGPFYFSPLKVFEYMAAGRAIVASGIGQIASLLIDGENALLTPPGDTVALANSLQRLYDDANLGLRLGANARQTVLEHHTWDIVVNSALCLTNPSVHMNSNLSCLGHAT